MFRSLRVASAGLAALIVGTLTGAAPAHAVDDTAPPVLVSVLVSPAAVNTSGSAQEITVTAVITDDLSGTSTGSLMFKSPSGTEQVDASLWLVSGDAHLGIYTGTITVPRYAEQGLWVLGSAIVMDVAGNTGTPVTAAFNATFAVDDNAINLPTAPTDVTATPGNGQVSLSWSPPSSDGGGPITSYTVTADAGTTAVPPVTSSITSATVTGLSNGTFHTFTVRASNIAGAGLAAYASATPRTVPGAPTGVLAVSGDESASVSWSPPADDGGAAISSYSVTVYSGASLVDTVTAADPSTTVTGLANGAAYTFKVAATNADETGDDSTASAAVTPSTVPGAPTGVSATAGNQQATVTWSAPSDDGGAAITGYSVTIYAGATSSTPLPPARRPSG